MIILVSLATLLAIDVPISISPTVSITTEGPRVSIGYTGVLQTAPSVSGPWMDATNAPNPLVRETTGTQVFYRTRSVDSASIFSSTNLVALSIRGPMQAHFELAFAGMPDGIFPPVREKPYFEGFLTIEGRQIPIDLRVRGNSSLQECPFPKLKFKVSTADRAGTPFYDAREVKIGTHCAEGGRGPIGRLRDQIAVFREALAYEAMATLEFLSPRVRRALVEYSDTTPPREGDEPGTTGWQVMRHALLFDDPEVVAARLGGRALDDQEITDLTNAGFDELLITKLRLLHVLLGNWDYALSVDGSELWNTEVIQLQGGAYLPMAGDFDLASWVTERVQVNAPWDYHPELPDLEREKRFQTEQVMKSVSPELFAAAREHFRSKRAELEALVAGAQLDNEGRANAQNHIAAFFSAFEPIRKSSAESAND